MRISKRDMRTAAIIVGSKAKEMNQKGASWKQGRRYLTCIDIGKIANKMLSSVSPHEQFIFPWDKKKSVTGKPE